MNTKCILKGVLSVHLVCVRKKVTHDLKTLRKSNNKGEFTRK